MVRPLKKRKEDGSPYRRPLKIEALLAEVLTAASADLRARGAITNKSDPGYLPPEILVHLIRYAIRMQDPDTYNALLSRLGERCVQALKSRVPYTNALDAIDVREEILSSFYTLFVDDLRSPETGVLDYFEVHFNHAFATLRAGIVRKAFAAAAPLSSLDEQTCEAEDDVDVELPDPSPEADVMVAVEKDQLHRLIQALPYEERQAVLWKHIYGFKTESTDPAEKTVASICGVSGSEIRSRLRSAYAILKKRMEE